MEHNPTVSIITPVYKSEKYLSKCIDSILNQTYKDFELILIDDGSPDNSGALCDEYANRDERIRVAHKKNAGASAARNVGISLSRGEWITFVDSDDWITPNYLESLIEYDVPVDFTMNYYQAVGWDGWVSNPPQQQLALDYESVRESLRRNLIGANFVCCKLLRTEIIKKNNLLFDQSLKYGEDTVFMYSYLLHAESIRIMPDVTYFYNCQNESSANKTLVNIDVLTESMHRIYLSTKRLAEKYDLENANVVNQIVRLTANRILYSILHTRNLRFGKIKEICQDPIIILDAKDKHLPKSKSKRIMNFLILYKLPLCIYILNKVINIK